MTYPAVQLQPGRERSLRRFHPFVFSRALAREPEDIPDGAVVRVADSGGTVLGVGHYQQRGSIRVRMLAFEDTAIDAAFWQQALRSAWRLRTSLGLTQSPDTNAFRLVHGEGDGLPGLVADWYHGHVVLQPHTEGMRQSIGHPRAALEAVLGTKLKAVIAAGAGEAGEPEGCDILEHRHRFRVNWAAGQKTGFYLDQRENRHLLARYASGRRVLNVFSYSGAFSVYALAAGATHVCSVESSRQAAAWAAENLALNDLPSERHEAVVADAFDYLKSMPAGFELVVLDPPAFAKHASARHRAIQAYRRVNAAAMRRIEPGGILFTFSCSEVVTPDLFRGAVLAAAIEAGRNIRILHQLHQPPDHPVSIFHPEGEYLKGFVLHVG
jgi:23S rRNA (cytosine1962-C5)-methyltransferase